MYDRSDIAEALELLAQSKGVSLSPNWQDGLDEVEFGHDHLDIARVCAKAGWPVPVPIRVRPRPDQFPLIVYGHGWGVAEQWENEEDIRLAGLRDSLWTYDDELVFFDVTFPDPLMGGSVPSAKSVFWRAIRRRKHVLVTAALATTIVNLLTLATSLYSMQLYDRVIPLASYSTLVVLTLGTVIALGFDFLLRTVRSLMIEREAAEIDAEVSEYFFARSQAVRLDARPPGVGTMAAQLRGLEQVRSVMSSGSLFLLADLPFALFFIVFIAGIGGVVALIPIVSLPLSLLMAYALSRIIRMGTDRAQVSGNRKNGLLVESLDAAETIKANRGGWFMLGRWNRLVRDVHHYEDPVKRASAIANSVFSTLQQVAYVAIMAVGALEVAEGNLTAGGLLACSIIAGRVNGPIVAMLPNLIIQWGYAKSSLRALDNILKLPLDRSSGEATLRPENLSGALQADGIRFSYPGAREGLEIERLQIAPGERVAIIGGVGSGKTTLLRILATLFHPQSGTVKMGGLELAQVADDVLRRHIGYLPQDFRLVNGTLRENLLLGLGGITDEQLLAQAKATGLDLLLASHPLGLDLEIQEGGRGLSGGQRTLVGLTRLLLANPRVWLLDEPTANLDQSSEAVVLKALLDNLAKDQTLVVVTHRMQLIQLFSRVILMNKGQIALDGPTKDVLARLQPAAASPQSRTVSSPVKSAVS